MITELDLGAQTLRGQSLGGMYTALHVPQFDALLDVGVALRTGASSKHLFLSHAHVDHLGALPSLLGMRGLMGVTEPLTVYAPAPVADGLNAALAGFGALHRWPLEVAVVPMQPGDEVSLRRDLSVRAFKTFHPVPSLGFLFFSHVQKLRAEFIDLPGPEIGRRRKAGEDLFDTAEHAHLAYATDTLPRVLEANPELLGVRTLVLECTFLDHRKTVEAARAGCHIHLDELLPFAPRLKNEHLVLMHFSQLYRPDEARRILRERWPADATPTVHAFAPAGGDWWN